MDILYILSAFLFLNALPNIFGTDLVELLLTDSVQHFVDDSLLSICRPAQQKYWDIPLNWKFPNGTTVDNTRGRVHIERRYDSFGKLKHLALIFKQIAAEDQGNWTCETTLIPKTLQFVNENVNTNKSFELLVNQKISFENTELVQSARQGRDAIVYCYVKGQPLPIVSWSFNGEDVNVINSTKHKKLSNGLFIKNVTVSDAGEYTCRAMRITPTFSDSDQITILLRIQQKPYWLYNETEFISYSYIGGTVNISCDALGEPPPSYTWTHAGRALTLPDNRVFYSDYGSTLQIYMRNETQFGDYKCKVSNTLGVIERLVKLRKGQKANPPKRFQLKRLYVNAFELDIKSVIYPILEDNDVGFDENMGTFGYHVEYMSEYDFKFSAGNWSYAKRKDFSLHQGRFYLTGLKQNTTYLLRAAARNLAGLSDWSAVKIFATLTNNGYKISTDVNSYICFIIVVTSLIRHIK